MLLLLGLGALSLALESSTFVLHQGVLWVRIANRRDCLELVIGSSLASLRVLGTELAGLGLECAIDGIDHV